MSIFRPANINKRLVGIQTQSPGNGGQIGPDKCPYCVKNPCVTLTLGVRCFGRGSCGGIFRSKESYCGVKECCVCPCGDCGGFYWCLSGTTKWFVAPSCTQVCRSFYDVSDAATVANSCVGSCGWFIPDCGPLYSSYTCRSYWDSYTSSFYWSGRGTYRSGAWGVDFSNGSLQLQSCTSLFPVRSFRCVL